MANAIPSILRSIPTLRSAAVWLSILAGGGAFAYMGDRFLTQPNTAAIIPDLEYVQHDKEVTHMLARMRAFEYASPSMFISASENIDRLLCAYHQVVSGAITHPTIDDRSRIYLLYMTAIEHLGGFYTACSNLSAEEQARVHDLYTKLYTVLQARWQAILSRTTHI